MVIPLSATYIALTLLLLIGVSFRVSVFRLRHQRGMGTDGNRDFDVAVRTQANLAEYAPLALIGLAVAELNGVPVAWIYWLGLIFIASRILHVWGMISGRGGTHPARFVGIMGTWGMMVATGLLLLWNAFGPSAWSVL